MASSTTKPTILIVPGAWHYPSHYSGIADQLRTHGYPVQIVDLPSVSACPQPSFQADVDEIRRTIIAILDGKDPDTTSINNASITTGTDSNINSTNSSTGPHIILFTHSWGSIPAYNAIASLTTTARRAANLPGGVSHLIFCAAFVVPVGSSLIFAFGGSDLPWFLVDAANQVVHPDGPVHVFYNDVDETTTKEAVRDLGPFSYQCFHSQVVYAGYRDVEESTYLHTERDNAIPIAVQRMMVEGVDGGVWRTEVLDAGHSPFFGRTREVVGAVRKVAGEVVQRERVVRRQKWILA